MCDMTPRHIAVSLLLPTRSPSAVRTARTWVWGRNHRSGFHSRRLASTLRRTGHLPRPRFRSLHPTHQPCDQETRSHSWARGSGLHRRLHPGSLIIRTTTVPNRVRPPRAGSGARVPTARIFTPFSEQYWMDVHAAIDGRPVQCLGGWSPGEDRRDSAVHLTEGCAASSGAWSGRIPFAFRTLGSERRQMAA